MAYACLLNNIRKVKFPKKQWIRKDSSLNYYSFFWEFVKAFGTSFSIHPKIPVNFVGFCLFHAVFSKKPHKILIKS